LTCHEIKNLTNSLSNCFGEIGQQLDRGDRSWVKAVLVDVINQDNTNKELVMSWIAKYKYRMKQDVVRQGEWILFNDKERV
jgi:hypothetical protein